MKLNTYRLKKENGTVIFLTDKKEVMDFAERFNENPMWAEEMDEKIHPQYFICFYTKEDESFLLMKKEGCMKFLDFPDDFNALKEEYESRLQVWQDRNSKEKDLFFEQVRIQMAKQEEKLVYLNEKISQANAIERMNKKRVRPTNVKADVKEYLYKLEQEEKSLVVFQFEKACMPEDRRYKYYCDIKNRMNYFPEFSFEKYDLEFKHLDFSIESSQLVYSFIEDVSSFLDSILEGEVIPQNENVKELQRKRRLIMSFLESLKNQMKSYRPCEAYIDFKNEYEKFMDFFWKVLDA